MNRYKLLRFIPFAFFFFCTIGVTSVHASNATAYISIEVKNTKKIYQEIQKIAAEKRALPISFSEYANSKTMKKSINISYVIPKEIVIDIMGMVANLGNVKSQSYNDKSSATGDIVAKTKMLDYYKSQLDRMIATQTAMPEAVSQLNYKIQGMEEEIAEYENQQQEGYSPKVDLKIQIKEYGYEGDDKGLMMSLNIIYFVAILSAVFFISFMLGFISSWFVLKKKNKQIPTNT